MTEDDRNLFLNTVGKITPVTNDTVQCELPKPKPNPRMQMADEARVMQEASSGTFNPDHLETGEELSYRQPGLQTRVFQKLARGQIRIEAEIDLHGLTVSDAVAQLTGFLVNARNLKKRCVKIIHGKGLGSRDGRPILKNKISRWLQRRDDILAFISARPMDGGTGAIYVLLKR